ncbi:MAG: NADH-quinone oxidoreductase subunit M [Deltaproteobacteria bacterium]|nr:NADH-quinone oxidoreductase subunit M [Deltaproteobacteria bacterium]
MDFLAPYNNWPILSTLIFLPLAGALLLPFFGRGHGARLWALAVTLADAALSIPLYSGFDTTTHRFQFAEHLPWVESLNIHYTLGVDGISLLLVLMTTLIMPLCVLCSWRAINSRLTEFFACILLMETSMLGVFLALDFVLFYIFWEAMLIPMFLLIGVWGGPRRIYASVKFFLYTLAGSVLLPVAGIVLYLHNSPHSFSIPELMGQPYPPALQLWVFLAFFAAFAVKVPMFPFHTWLPAAHVEAPTAGSVILASVLLKMGAYGFLRFSLPMTPLGVEACAPWVLALSVAAILYGGFTALAQSDMKRLVAYSSVAHMGFVTLGIFILNTRGVEGAILQMINHAVTTGALFLCVGIIYERTHSRELAAATGIGRVMPAYVTGLTVFGLSSLAFPGTNGFVGEFLILAGAFTFSPELTTLTIPGVVLGAAYMLRMLQRMIWGGTQNPDTSQLVDLNAREALTLAFLVVFVIWIGLAPAPFTDVLHVSVEHLLEQVRAGMGR